VKSLICGVDEAGRGPLAGPVYAAAVILGERGRAIVGIDDSKKLSEAKRDKLAIEIKLHALAWAIVAVDVETIDRINILQATMLAMHRAVSQLDASAIASLANIVVDGTHIPRDLKQWCIERNVAVQALPKADATVIEVGAASILAKTERDAHMLELHRQFPHYGFAAHKGYGTATHMAAINDHGPCIHHRRSFAPIAQWKLL
jgi:ribonuclease HII